MSEAIQEAYEAESDEAQERTAAGERRRRWFEVCLVLCVSLGGFFFNSLYVLIGHTGSAPYLRGAGWLPWTQSIVQEVGGLVLLGYILGRRKLRFRDIGLQWSVRDLGLAVVVALASYFAYGVGAAVVHRLLYWSGPPSPYWTRALSHPSWVAVPFILINPFFEELIVRAYLMTEVKALTGSWLLAGFLSVLVQTSYHLYQGWESALSLSFQFLTFSYFYALTRKATPLVVAHGFFDVWGLMRLW
jgi:membrane protease YdiL (CAAX protease family)